MGRSKFPGKPPKAVTRKRIKVLGRPETASSDSVTVAENIYYGLSLFNETFGDNEKEHPPFHGFSSNEAKLSASYIKTQQRDAGNVTDKSTSVASETNLSELKNKEKTVTHLKDFSSDTENRKSEICDNESTSNKDTGLNSLAIVSTEAIKICKSIDGKSEGKKKYLNLSKTPVLKSVNNIIDRHQRTRQLRNSTAKRLLQRAKTASSASRSSQIHSSDKSSSVRKFVLPMRSAHSSRVIKPNKRFIEELESISNQEHSENDAMKQHAKKAKMSLAKTENSDKQEAKSKMKKIVQPLISSAQGQQEKDLSEKISESAKIKSCTTHNSMQKITTSDGTFLTKALPDTNHSNSESSRIKTRSGTLGIPYSDRMKFPISETSDSCKTNSCTDDVTERNCRDVAMVDEQNKDKFETESTMSESGSEHSNHTEDEQSDWSGMKLNGGKVILRKARLKLDNKSLGGTEGPFSMVNTQNSMGLSSSIKCGVCGAVRFYRFVKQTRKFGVQSCVSCRKFITKMKERQACAKSTNSILPVLQCVQGDGLCLIAPVVRNQEWNVLRCAYKTRCHACWLKMCLKFYNIPASVRSGLNAMLPPMMRIGLPLSQDVTTDVHNQKLTGCKISWPAEESLEKNLFKSAMMWNNMQLEQKTGYQNNIGGFLSRKLDKCDYPISISPNKKRKKDNRIKVRKKIKNISYASSTFNQYQQTFRQRVELRGPRVKHVCRSASVALGQPLATFPSVDGKEDMEVQNSKNIPKVQKEEDKIMKKEEVTKEPKDLHKASHESINCNININSQPPHSKRGKAQQNTSSSNLTMTRSLTKPPVAPVHTISIDFWEQYDPAEVGAKGFALIGSELFHIPAICYLCGSAGKEPLIHCQCCCEPYHPYCLEPSEWNACSQPNWCCPRCTICQTCQLRSGPKLSCIRCRQSFHHSCLSKSGVSARLYSPDRPYVCQNCIKCKSCGSEGVNVYVGNLPLCSMCFKLRQRGNYCPLCQKCYNENDFDTKMMECNECSCWVHARCEGLSDERYQILSYLPDSVEFTCRQCSPSPNSVWRNAIEAELKAGFIAVIKSLSKNRKACTALKWSPRKECLCRPISSVRKLDFSDEKLECGNFNVKETKADDTEDYSSERSVESESNLPPKSDISSKIDMDVDEHPIDGARRVLRRLRQKRKDLYESEKRSTLTQEDFIISDIKECSCSDQHIIARPSPTLMSVKRKVNGNEYGSLFQFHCDMEHVISRAGMPELTQAYHKTLHEVFPWFDIRQSKDTRDLDLLLTPTKETCKDVSDISPMKLDDPISDAWKEEILKAPKAITAKSTNLYSNIHIEDSRSCCLCKGLSDGQETKEGRLLYCGQNEWVHANCALWSNEVFEEIDGSLQNVHSAISRGRMIRCTECGKKGASIGCCSKNCGNTFHFPCAKNVGLVFNDDKTVFCSLHSTNCGRKPQSELDFILKRPVYAELDRRKKKFAEPDKVKVMIGSLTVDCLGTIIPEFSDTVEKIIPSGYKCTRLYWSTTNPTKIVRYYIRTYIQVCVPDTSSEAENNVTIDHSVERKQAEDAELAIIKQSLEALIDSVCNKEVDENLAEQNNTDLLPPELKEAIFEDLPHDLLDGISMQDIFPKTSYEDFLAMDLKNDDLLKDDILPAENDDVSKSKTDQTENDFLLHLETKNTVQDLMDDLLMNSKSQKLYSKELKRSKSEVIPANILPKNQQQRSCSLTWSCKLDATMKKRKFSRNCGAIKSDSIGYAERDSIFSELRIPDSITLTVGKTNSPSMTSDSVRELKYCVEDSSGINRRIVAPRDDNKDHKRLMWHARQQPRIVQVDGAVDPGSSSSECSSPEYNLDERILIPQLDGADDDSCCSRISEWTVGNGKKGIESGNIFKFDTESRKKLTLQIPQLDGEDDVSSDDDCVSQFSEKQESIVSSNYVVTDRPVSCKRCQCTYRTQDSYNRHLANCEIMTTSDSDSDIMDNKLASPDSRFSPSNEFITMSPSEGHTLTSEYPDVQATSPLEASVPSPHPGIQIEPIGQAIITPQIHTHATVETVHQTVLTTNDVIVQTQYTRTTTTLPNATVLPQEGGVQITEIPTDQASHNVPINSVEGSILQNISSPTYSTANLHTSTVNESTQQRIQSSKMPKVKSPRTPKIRSKTVKTYARNATHATPCGARFQTVTNNGPLIQLQQQPPQRAVAPTVILQQVAPQGIMSTYVETLQQQQQPQQQQQQSGQNVHYIAAIGNQPEPFKPQFIAANSIVPGAYIQASSDNLLTLQNAGISVLPNVQIAQPQPTVLGTIIQQQPSAIQCGVISSEQLVLSSTPTLEMFTDSTGSMFVSSQPMYYGLETIVSNTVMSSSQFMTGAVPQVLASSYQTTTQVFQASKLMEPIVDVQAVPAVPAMPNVPTVSAIPNVPTVSTLPNVPSVSTIPTVPAVQPVQSVPGLPGSYVVVNQQPAPISAESIPTTTRLNISQNLEQSFVPVSQNLITPVASQPMMESAKHVQNPEMQPIISNLNPTPPLSSSPPKPLQQNIPTIPRVAVRPSPVTQQDNPTWKIAEPLLGPEQPISTRARPYLDSKHVSENTSMIKSSISSRIPPLPNHCIAQRTITVNKFNNEHVNTAHNSFSNTAMSTGNSSSANVTSSPVSNLCNSVQNKMTMPTNNNTPTSRPMNRVLPMQAIIPKQDPRNVVEKPKIIEEPTKPDMKSAKSELEESEKSPPDESVTEQAMKEYTRKDNLEVSPDEKIMAIEKVQENVKEDLDQKEKIQNTSLKIILQKQFQDGSYKITHNMKNQVKNKTMSILEEKSENVPPPPTIHTSLPLLPMKKFELKTNKSSDVKKVTSSLPKNNTTNTAKPKPPPIAVKKPRLIAKTMNHRTQKKNLTKPSLMYEIKSQDGFTHTASSMSEVWDMVFQAVQNARKAHNLPPLPYNPLTENLGLENNATVYLVEQLPNVNRCTKYKPKFHELKPPKPGEGDNDLPTECDSGAARAEPFNGRKVHDMFSWLASRHRQQPKMIAISETESRRAASTNLPMAMRFRILKETSKESVGVYHSHIHGRGLFCLRDIEAGEMVIEYAGEVIRSSLTDKREKYYDSKNIGCYMFKIDDHLVVDATMKGNAARFINHSCEPNCYSRVVDILGKKHILIFALRRIIQGEELTYDYKFPFEDIKIPCTCGSRRCRKYLN